MKLSVLANLIPLHLSGTFSTSGSDLVGTILVIGLVIVAAVIAIGQYVLKPVLTYLQHSEKVQPKSPRQKKSLVTAKKSHRCAGGQK